jgi:membrane protein implicated in regulation of membrane protease activity
MTQFWFIISTAFIVLELTNPGLFFFLALSLGALATMFAQLQGMSLVDQYIFFFISSGIMFYVLTLLIKALQKKKQSQKYDSNVDLLIGKTVEITELISLDTGYGQVDGEIWMVKLHDKNQNLKIGMQALVIGVKGCHLKIVSIIKNQ